MSRAWMLLLACLVAQWLPARTLEHGTLTFSLPYDMMTSSTTSSLTARATNYRYRAFYWDRNASRIVPTDDDDNILVGTFPVSVRNVVVGNYLVSLAGVGADGSVVSSALLRVSVVSNLDTSQGYSIQHEALDWMTPPAAKLAAAVGQLTVAEVPAIAGRCDPVEVVFTAVYGGGGSGSVSVFAKAPMTSVAVPALLSSSGTVYVRHRCVGAGNKTAFSATTRLRKDADNSTSDAVEISAGIDSTLVAVAAGAGGGCVLVVAGLFFLIRQNRSRTVKESVYTFGGRNTPAAPGHKQRESNASSSTLLNSSRQHYRRKSSSGGGGDDGVDAFEVLYPRGWPTATTSKGSTLERVRRASVSVLSAPASQCSNGGGTFEVHFAKRWPSSGLCSEQQQQHKGPKHELAYASGGFQPNTSSFHAGNSTFHTGSSSFDGGTSSFHTGNSSLHTGKNTFGGSSTFPTSSSSFHTGNSSFHTGTNAFNSSNSTLLTGSGSPTFTSGFVNAGATDDTKACNSTAETATSGGYPHESTVPSASCPSSMQPCHDFELAQLPAPSDELWSSPLVIRGSFLDDSTINMYTYNSRGELLPLPKPVRRPEGFRYNRHGECLPLEMPLSTRSLAIHRCSCPAERVPLRMDAPAETPAHHRHSCPAERILPMPAETLEPLVMLPSSFRIGFASTDTSSPVETLSVASNRPASYQHISRDEHPSPAPSPAPSGCITPRAGRHSDPLPLPGHKKIGYLYDSQGGYLH